MKITNSHKVNLFMFMKRKQIQDSLKQKFAIRAEISLTEF